MRSWTIAAALLLGLAAQAGMAVASDAAGQRGPQPEKPAAGSAPASGATRSSTPSSTAPSRSDSPSRPDSASTSPSHAASGDAAPEADGANGANGADSADGTDSADGQRTPRTGRSRPAASPATAAPPPAVFIISCNASGCNDNQGRFLTRSGPRRLVGPNGLSCQLMGGNWQCSPGTAP